MEAKKEERGSPVGRPDTQAIFTLDSVSSLQIGYREIAPASRNRQNLV